MKTSEEKLPPKEKILNENVYKKLIRLEELLRSYSVENTKVNLARKINVSERTIANYFKLLEERGIELKRVDGKNASTYCYRDVTQTIKSTYLHRDDLLELQEFQALINNKQSIKHLPWIGNLNARLQQSIDSQLQEPLQPIIYFDEPKCFDPQIQQKIDGFYQSIRGEEVVRIGYKKFGGTKRYYKLSPYFLKEHKHMWYVYGYNHAKKVQVQHPCLALDRIVSVEVLKDETYHPMPATITPEKWFDNNLGITIHDDLKPELIQFKVTRDLFYYLKNYPLDTSQVLDEAQMVLTVKLLINYELMQWILGYGEQLVVLSPPHLREKVKNRILKQLSNYP